MLVRISKRTLEAAQAFLNLRQSWNPSNFWWCFTFSDLHTPVTANDMLLFPFSLPKHENIRDSCVYLFFCGNFPHNVCFLFCKQREKNEKIFIYASANRRNFPPWRQRHEKSSLLTFGDNDIWGSGANFKSLEIASKLIINSTCFWRFECFRNLLGEKLLKSV